MPPVRRDVIYPIFLKCLPFAEDEFWRETFEGLSYGDCYQGAYLNKGFLCSSTKGKEFIYKFMDKEPARIYQDVSKLLKEKLNIMSRNDRKILLSEFDDVEHTLMLAKQADWNDIKKKSLKDILFQNYLIKMKHTHDLREAQVRCIYNAINLGLMLKSLKNTDIVYRDCEIKEIKGFHFSKGRYRIDFDIYAGLEDETVKVSGKKEEKRLRDL